MYICKYYIPTLVWKQTHMRVRLPMTSQALPEAIGPVSNVVPFIPSEWSRPDRHYLVFSISLSLYIYIHICVCTYMYVCICIYIHIYT